MSRLQAPKGKKKWFSSLEERSNMPTLKIKIDSKKHAIQACAIPITQKHFFWKAQF
jgi:hypothetical protein